jgi:hypothetical protein
MAIYPFLTSFEASRSLDNINTGLALMDEVRTYLMENEGVYTLK